MTKIDLPVAWITPRTVGFQRRDGSIAVVSKSDLHEIDDPLDDGLYAYQANEEVFEKYSLK
jgi:hypothetical protein